MPWERLGESPEGAREGSSESDGVGRGRRRQRVIGDLREERYGPGAQKGGKVISVAEDSYDMVLSILICLGLPWEFHTSGEVASWGESELIAYIFLPFFTHFSYKHILTP